MLSFTWASLTVDIVVIIILILRSGTSFKQKENSAFMIFPLILIIVGLAYGLTEKPIPTYVFRNVDSFFLVRSAGIIFKLFLAYYIVVYMVIFVHDKRRRLLHMLLDPVMLAAVIEIIINIFQHNVFYFDSDFSLYTGPLNVTFYVFATYYYCVGAVVLLLNRRKVSHGVTAAVLTIAMLSAIAMFVQAELPVKNFDLFVHSICCILMLYTLLDSKDLVNALTKKNEEIKQLTEQSMLALTSAIEAKDHYTSGHSVRVAEYSKKIAEHMGMNETEITSIYYAALMHDVGKIGIPLNIIDKPTRLTKDEYDTIKKHTVIGASITHPITAMSMIEQGVRWHHERFDGCGYPDGLKGTEIPLVARIIGIADSYDAMTTTRSYRGALNESHAEEEIRKGLGTQFDTEIGKIMLEILKQKREKNQLLAEGLN
jgi:putative nucleotidyltransferase with HDIG domain